MPGGFLTGSQYASLALYLVIGAILASNGATEIGRFYGVKKSLLYGVLAIAIGMGIMGITPFVSNQDLDFRYPSLVISQFFLGMGVGAILTSANAFLVLFMFKRTAMLLTGMYSCITLGSSSAPFFIGKFSGFWNWGVFPTIIACLFLILLLVSYWQLPHISNPYPISREPLKVIFKKLPGFFWVFAIAAFLYAICENGLVAWSTIFLHLEKGVKNEEATESLAIFWGVVTIAELSICGLVSKFSPRFIYRLLPLFLIIACFGMVFASGANQSLLFFVTGALGVSAFFALTVNFAERRFHELAEFVSGTMVLGYFLGTVVGSLATGFFYEILHWPLAMVFVAIGCIAILLTPLNYILSRPRATSSNL